MSFLPHEIQLHTLYNSTGTRGSLRLFGSPELLASWFSKIFEDYEPIGANDPLCMANLDHRGMVGNLAGYT